MYFKDTNVIWVGRVKYEAGWLNQRHMHTFFHMIYFTAGKGWMKVNDTRYDLKSGQLFLVPPGNEHEFVCDMTFPLKTIEVKFVVYNSVLRNDLMEAGIRIDMDTTEVSTILESLVNEALFQNLLYRDIINSSFFLVLVKILKNIKCGEEKKKTPSNASIDDFSYKGNNLRQVFEYIASNLSSHITLEKLSSVAALSPTHLCRIFKEKYGVTPVRYINELRLKKAKQLLLDSDLNITQIAEITGFQTVHYFSRYFKKMENISPLGYKEKFRDSIYIKLEEKYESM